MRYCHIMREIGRSVSACLEIIYNKIETLDNTYQIGVYRFISNIELSHFNH